MHILQTLADQVVAQSSHLQAISRDIHARPELAYQEFYASQRLADALADAGLSVEKPLGGLETAFRARIRPRNGGDDLPKVAILAEYDALPEIGHACGHNLIGTAAIGAGLALAAVAEHLPGEIHIIGTPAEEGGGGKIKLIEAGVFAGLDAAMMFHPFDRNLLSHEALAMHQLEVRFRGVPSHAAAAPWDGYSALSGVIQTFNLIDNLRVHLREGTRIHGIITDGGQAVNIIPETASCRFSLRAREATYLEDVVVPRVQACAQAAALATGTQVELILHRGYRNMWNNQPLAHVFGECLASAGAPFADSDPSCGAGSTDMGDVSQIVPSIHPYLAICAPGETLCHQHAFAAYAASDQGHQTLLLAATCLAQTAWRVLAEPELRAQAWAAFQGCSG